MPFIAFSPPPVIIPSMQYTIPANPTQIRQQLRRLCLHHDHLKQLQATYTLMRQQQTYAPMQDPTFQVAPLTEQNQFEQQHYTALIIPLPHTQQPAFWQPLHAIYQQTTALITQYFPNAYITMAPEAAHITIKAITNGRFHAQTHLQPYATLIRPVIHRWLSTMAAHTELHALGLFSHLHPSKGLAIGVRFYPTLPLLQLIRGEVGRALYTHQPPLPLRPETAFHTTLVHSTGLRARGLSTPFPPAFIDQFKQLLEQHDDTLFGTISQLTPTDFAIRNGRSDALHLGTEISLT